MVAPSRRLIRFASLVVLFLLVFPAMAVAEGESIRGSLQVRADGAQTAAEGVQLTVRLGGDEVGTAVSDAEGDWEIPVPGPGLYDVELDQSSLPEGVGLTDPDRSVLTDVEVLEGRSKTVLFPLGESSITRISNYERIGTLFVAGMKLGAVIALCAVGLSLVFAVTGLVNFAHGEMVTLGAILAYFFHTSPGGPQWPLVVAAIPAIALGAGFGWIQDRGLWRPLRKRGMGLISMMVVSIGVAFALRHTFLVVFSGQRRLYRDFTGQGPTDILGIPVVPKHLVTVVVAIVVLGAVGLFLQKTKMGTALRAVSDDVDLSESSGINVDRVITLTWVLAGGLAAVGGIIYGSNEAIQWDMGFRLLLLIFAAVVLGGLGTAYGAMVGGFIVGISVEMSTLIVPSELKGAVGLVLLILMLLVRPQGILGSRERIG